MERSIKAIPTNYNRINFRSRIEARWAVFFDLVGIAWDYEPEKYHTGASRYIPDFLLRRLDFDDKDILLEVKGKLPDPVEIERAANVEAMVVSGSLIDYRLIMPFTWKGGQHETEYVFQQCPLCGKIGLQSKHEDIDFTPQNDPNCLRLERLAEHFDIEDYFWDWKVSGRPNLEPHSPIIQLSIDWAHNAKFEDPNFYEHLEEKKQILKRLTGFGVFSSSNQVLEIALHALRCKRSPGAPQFNHIDAGYQPESTGHFQVVEELAPED